MSKFWQERNPVLYNRTRAEVESKYPTLHFQVRDRIVSVVGSFPITDDKGVVDSFEVEIQLPPNSPKQLPTVRETKERIPRTLDRHMLKDGVACPFVPEDWWMSHPDGYTLLEFLDGPVRTYFVEQSMVELGMGWPFGERSHGARGILECCQEMTGAQTLDIASAFLALLAEKRIDGRQECPCGSGYMLRHCHLPVLLRLRSGIPWHVSRASWLKVSQQSLRTLAR
jgi:hypothetical protein